MKTASSPFRVTICTKRFLLNVELESNDSTMKSFVFLLFFIATHLTFSQSPLLGEWCLANNCNSKLIFHQDGTFELAINGSFIESLGNEELKYKEEKIGDENWVSVSNKSNTTFVKFKYELENCNLLIVYYKIGKEIDHDIDEIGWYKKINCTTPLSSPVHTQTFIVPDYFSGELYIIFSGEQKLKEKSARFKIPPAGVLNIPFKAEPFDLLRGGLVFLSPNRDTIKQFIKGNKTPSPSNIDLNEKYAEVVGFNQTGRENLESRFGISDKIRDVLMIKIAPFIDLIQKE